MKNQTWLYLDNNHTSLYLYMDEYFYSLRAYEKVHDNNKVRIEVSFSNYGNGALRVRCWYGRSTEEGKEIYDITYPYRKNLKCVFTVSFPDSRPSHWIPMKTPYTMHDLRLSKDQAIYYQGHKGLEFVSTSKKSDDQDYIILKVDEYITKEEAKDLWNNIKKNGLVSKFSWDSWMGYYDCYCKACAVDKVKNGEIVDNWRSWVGNPDVGFVREVAFKCSKDDNVFKYKNKLYEPCNVDEYDTLLFLNKDEYNATIKKGGWTDMKPFDKLWDIELTQEEIDSNGNVVGGGWRNLETKEVIDKETDRLLDTSKYEKVVTLGWHRTNPSNAIHCPVCEDLYNIICQSSYDPLPITLRIKSKIKNTFRDIQRRLEVKRADKQYYKKHKGEN